MHSSAMNTHAGVSIITATNRPQFMHALFENYNRQTYKNKELIVILNKDTAALHNYFQSARHIPNTRIYQVPEHLSLGSCLNYGASLANYPLIAKFDDDDYYASHYLTESVQAMQRTNADIVGKRAHYMYLHGSKTLLLRYYNKENCYAPLVQGATLLIRRSVLNKVRFPNRNNGECVAFCTACRAKGFKIYSGSRFNFLAHRRTNSSDHTWIVSDRRLRQGKVKVVKAEDILKHVIRTLW
ncbi:glycosyltransferase family 2 protein [Paenibacillus sambharensis]|uniref:Glycosyltransferase family 2 protein n=1 Tax=Paenibacillus sambharensis TaxID=1803190 RepID=A0A2W1LER7_9BACL|nr:glycosyltransferase family A protein [Paenibacillus sambharensis]PZD96530.1 glycosyltransferase family 2 protein [Paenibacillus sambharensis]